MANEELQLRYMHKKTASLRKRFVVSILLMN
jgi:hypothetical protein